MKFQNLTHFEKPVFPTISRRTALIGLVGLIAAGCGSPSTAEVNNTPTPLATTAATIPPTATAVATTTTVPRGQKILTYQEQQAMAVAWAPDGQRIASGGEKGEVHIWDAATGQTSLSYVPSSTGVHSNSIEGLAWSPDGKSLASVTLADNAISIFSIWDIDANKLKFTFSQHALDIAWSPDGTMVAGVSGGDIAGEQIVQVWDAASGTQKVAYNDHRTLVKSFSWSPDSKYIVSAGRYDLGGQFRGKPAVYIWESQTGKTTRTYSNEGSSYVAWSPDGASIASEIVTKDGDKSKDTVNIGSASSGQQTLSYPIDSEGIGIGVMGLAWSPNGKYLAATGGSPQQPLPSSIHVRDTTSEDTFIYKGHTRLITSLSWSPDGTRIASASIDSTVQVWQAI
jgi:WD40 repeat protein